VSAASIDCDKERYVMPLARISIEQTSAHGWVAELEAGGIVARAARLQASSFETLLEQVRVTYRSLTASNAKSEAPLPLAARDPRRATLRLGAPRP
jgi:hypothetical protein